MAYTPTNWSTGDTITASDMNKLENAVANAGSALIATCSWNDTLNNLALDKTAQEIYDAILGGTPAYIKYQYGALGSSGTGNYVSQTFLAPIIHIYGYDYAGVIRITASRPTLKGSASGKDFLFSPSVVIFSASGMNDYPVIYASVKTADANETVNGEVL